jgi:hypothetical protein
MTIKDLADLFTPKAPILRPPPWALKVNRPRVAEYVDKFGKDYQTMCQIWWARGDITNGR